MGDWQVFADKTKALLNSENLTEAREQVEAGLEKYPNEINLLTIASDIFRASNDREKSLEYSKLLITHHPENWNGYERTAQDLVALKRFEDALEIVNNTSTTTNELISKLKQDLERRKILGNISRSMNLPSGRKYPSFCIAGNCQSQPLETWLNSSFPFCSINTLIPYHTIKDQSQIDTWIKEAIQADFVIMIPVGDSYEGFKFGSNYVRSLLSEKSKFISYPSYHLEVFFPFFGYAKDSTGATLSAAKTSKFGHQYGDYHDFLAMALSTKDKDAQTNFYNRIQETDKSESFNSSTIIKLGMESFHEFEKRYPDYIQLIKSDIRNGIAHTFNHPTGTVLNEIYKKIWTKDLGLNISDFLDFTQDPLSGMKLPIPPFVSRTILGKAINTPWEVLSDTNSMCIHEDINEYINKVKGCISYYKRNPDILEWNAKHKKLVSSDNFLHELGI